MKLYNDNHLENPEYDASQTQKFHGNITPERQKKKKLIYSFLSSSLFCVPKNNKGNSQESYPITSILNCQADQE
jgi:hypothetical protein